MSDIILGLLMFLLFMAFWITPVVFGIRAARKKLRSPHWMWFGVHPIGGWITFAVLASLSLILLATTMLGGTLIFPTTKTWLGGDSQPRIPSTRPTV